MPHTIDLEAFCCETSRYSLLHPFVQDGWQYATDGRIMVAVPAEGEPDSAEPDKRYPKGMASYLIEPTDAEFVPWPESGYCYACDGNGVANLPCEACGHEREVSCECRSVDPLEICGRRVSRYYAQKIAGLPKVECTAGEGESVFFRFDGGKGRVCGIARASGGNRTANP